MRETLRRALPPLVGLALFGAALEVLRRELQLTTVQILGQHIAATPASRLAAAVALTAANYAVLTAYDFLALRYVGRTLSRWRVVIASFLAYAIANNIGFATLSGASVRYRFYSRWGITAQELSRIVVSYSVTFWLGLITLGGLSLAITPLPGAGALPGHALYRPAGWGLLATAAAYLLLTVMRRKPIETPWFSLAVPSSAMAVAQLAVSAADWALAAAVLYVLLPPSALSFLAFVGVFAAAQLIGLISNVPGGVGVFEGLTVLLLKPYLSPTELLPALVVYRATYYLLPLAIALVGLVADEARQHGARARRVGAALGQLTEVLTPRVLAFFTFLGGVLLLFSGATPAAAGRLPLLHRLLPLGLIESSHFLGSVVGAALLLLSQGLSRRLDAAYQLSALALMVGMAASILKGGDYEEAILLGLLLGVLVRARPAFDRKAALLEARFSPAWFAAIVGALAASVWLGFFAYRHVEYSSELWWHFTLRGGGASRFLRASVGAATVVLLFAVARLMKPTPHEADPPSEEDLEAAGRAIERQHGTMPWLVYLRDKALLFNDERTAFVMYGVQGRTWAALGDPVGRPEELSDLIRTFLERCDDFDGIPVFYEVRKEHLHLYADYGLTFVKVGEEAHLDLHKFTLEGGAGSRHRQAMRRLARAGGTFRIVPVEDVPAILPELRAVSDEWLSAKSAAEKGFSLGFFDEAYIARFPVAVAEQGGRIAAFANLWPGPDRVELSVDLMRYRSDAPKDVMESILAHVLAWGHDQGYDWFSLGMAPLSGFESSPVAPLWNRLGAFLYEHGEAFYNFQGLRAYKEKFDPVWQPRYLAYPGALRLPRILADLAALIAGGYRNILRK